MQVKSLSNVNFQRGMDLDQASAFVNMDDSQLKYLAYASTVQDGHGEKKNRKTLARTFYAIPIVDSLSKGILTRGAEASLTKKMAATGKAAGFWALGLSVIGLYNLVKNKIVSKSETMQKVERNNPLLSFMVDIGILSVGFAAGTTGLTKLAEKTQTKFPKFFENIAGKIKNAKTWLDASKANTKILPKINAFEQAAAKKLPKLAGAGEFALRKSIWVVLGLGILKLAVNAKHERKRVENTYKEIKKAQFETAKHLANKLNVENDVLLQEQERMTEDLRDAVDSSECID